MLVRSTRLRRTGQRLQSTLSAATKQLLADTGATMPPLTAALCYRFVLNSPHVHATWTGPANREQLDENLAALEAGPLSVEEEAWVREYGKQVKAKRKRDYV